MLLIFLKFYLILTFIGIMFGGGKKTIKRHKGIQEGTKLYKLQKYAEKTLGSGNLRSAVKLPPGEDINDWLAVNTVDFFNQIGMLYGTIGEFCTPESCPVMSAGPKYEFYWADGEEIKKPIRVSAPEYVDYLMNWVQKQLDNETIFPSEVDVAFPKNFRSIVQKILNRLFRVYAHIYHSHFQKIIALGEEAHINTSLKHFIFFVQEFHLLKKDALEPLADLVEEFNNRK